MHRAAFAFIALSALWSCSPKTMAAEPLSAEVEITIVACLTLTPATCRSERVVVLAPQSEQEDAARVCSLAGPSLAAHWAMRHPGWQVMRWRCGPPGQEV